MGFGKDGKGVIIREARTQALGGLANATGIIIGANLALTDSFRMLKSVGHFHIDGLTAGQAGGLTLWLANGDLSLAEAEAAIELSGPLDRSARTENEIAQRFVKIVGAVIDPDMGDDESTFRDAHTGAPVIITKPRWTFGQTTAWNWIVYNNGEVITTGATVRIRTQNFGVWVGA